VAEDELGLGLGERRWGQAALRRATTSCPRPWRAGGGEACACGQRRRCEEEGTDEEGHGHAQSVGGIVLHPPVVVPGHLVERADGHGRQEEGETEAGP
jgi:hypothetical protein